MCLPFVGEKVSLCAPIYAGGEGFRNLPASLSLSIRTGKFKNLQMKCRFRIINSFRYKGHENQLTYSWYVNRNRNAKFILIAYPHSQKTSGISGDPNNRGADVRYPCLPMAEAQDLNRDH